MKHRFLLFFTVVWFALLPATPGFCAEDLHFSCSAQVAEAFGKPLMQTFMQTSGITVNTHVSSSNLAISRLLNGFSEIAGSARTLNVHETESGLIEIPICKDPMAVIVHRNCPAVSLSGDQVRRIFSGEVVNWKPICGTDIPITVIVPGKDTAAFDNFQRMAMRMNDIRYDFMTWKSTAAVEAVRYLPGAVSFIGHVAAYDEPDIKMLAVDGKTITDDAYPYMQTFSLVTRSKPNPGARALIDFALSDRVTDFIVTNNMFPVID
jgi:ABC-type phosphate transport system substrate-binding protein